MERAKSNLVFVLMIAIFSGTGLYFVYQNFIPALAIGTFSDDFVTVDSMDVQDWTAVGGTNLSLKDDFQMEGAGMIQALIGSAGTNYGMSKDFSLNLQNKQFWYYLWAGAGGYGAFRDVSSNVRIVLYNGAGATGNNATWFACTTDCPTKLAFGMNSVKFYTTQPESVSGAFDAASIQSIALLFDTSNKLTEKAGSVNGWDFLRAGTKISFTGGSASNPVTFQDVKNYSDMTPDNRPLGVIDIIAGSFVNLQASLEIGESTGANSTYFQDTDKFIFMNMFNSDDKIRFILQPNSTTTFGKFEAGFAVSGNTVAYPGGNLRSIPFRFPSTATPLPNLYLYASKISKSDSVYFGESDTQRIGAGQSISSEIDNASTTYIYSPDLQLNNFSIHHNATSTNALEIRAQPNTPYEIGRAHV